MEFQAPFFLQEFIFPRVVHQGNHTVISKYLEWIRLKSEKIVKLQQNNLNGWEDYTFWQTEDKKTLKKINNLLKDIDRNGNEGVGKPEPLTDTLSGYWSRRINEKDRLVYCIDENNIYILVCRYHYTDQKIQVTE